MKKSRISFVILLLVVSMLTACSKNNDAKIKNETTEETNEQSEGRETESAEPIDGDNGDKSQDADGLDLSKLDTTQFDPSKFEGQIRFNKHEFDDYTYTGDLFELSELTVDNVLEHGYTLIPQYANGDFDFDELMEPGDGYSCYVRKYTSDDDFISGYELAILNLSENDMTVRECVDAKMYYFTDDGNISTQTVLNNVPEEFYTFNETEAPGFLLEVLGNPSHISVYDDIGVTNLLCYEYEGGTLAFHINVIADNNYFNSVYCFPQEIWETVKTDYYEKSNPFFWTE